MKQKIRLGLLTIALCFVQSGHAQLSELSCEEKAERLLLVKDQFPGYSAELIDQLISYIAPCADFDNDQNIAKAHYVRGLLHLQKGDFYYAYGQRLERSNAHIGKAASLNYIPAAFTHGYNMVTDQYFTVPVGYQTTSNLQKAIDNGYKTDISHYLLGYAKLKNFTSGTRVDFSSSTQVAQAKAHFEQSNHPMAKHWLAIMNYKGIGVPQDKAKATQMLNDNGIFNSNILVNVLDTQNNDWIPISAQERTALIEGFKTLPDAETIINTDIGDINKFEGHLIEYDWSATGVQRHIPVTLEFEITGETSSYKRAEYTFDIDGTIIPGRCRIYGSRDINFFDAVLELTLNRLLKDHPDKSTLTYRLKNFNIRETILDNKQALIARASIGHNFSYIEELNEPIRQPLGMILYPVSSTVSQALASDVDDDLNKSTAPVTLDKHFATIAPNPIGDQFNITYRLEQSAEVTVGIYDFFGKQRIRVPAQKNKSGADQIVTIDSSSLPSGTYVVQMTINGQPYSKMVIKE